jgi:hypothetical protein
LPESDTEGARLVLSPALSLRGCWPSSAALAMLALRRNGTAAP